MGLIDTAERLLPARLKRRVAPLAARLDGLLEARGERAVAQRMSLIAFAIRIASAAIAFLSQVILARFLGTFEYGIYVFVWTLALIVGVLACLGFDIAVIRFLPQYRAAGSHAEIHGLAVAARVTAMVSAVVIGAFAVAALVLFGSFVESYYLIPLYIGVLILPMIALNAVLDGTSRASGWVVSALAPAYIVRPLLILVFVAGVMFAGLGVTAVTALLCALAATCATTLGQLLIVKHRLGRHYAAEAISVDIRMWMRVSLPILLVEGFYFLLTNSDVVVVGLFLDPDKVAVYFAAAKCMALVHFVYFAIKAGAGPRFSELVATRRRNELAASVRETIHWTLWPSLVIGGIVLALGPFLLALFGPDFTSGVGIMAILFLGIIAKASVGPGESLLTMADEQKICVGVYAGALAILVVANIVLIPIYGIYGAAIATAAGMTTEALLLYLAVRRRLGISLSVFTRRPGAEPPIDEMEIG